MIPLILAAAVSCIAIDGDTLRCGKDRVRLLGIDAPEMPGHCRRGRMCAPGDPYASKASLAKIIAGSGLRIEAVTRDRYGRVVAMVWAGDRNLSCAQLKARQAIYMAKWDNGRRLAKVCSYAR
ncbi:MAG: nuclease [Sphingobium sp.]|nr:MAG: nuclease [Sphingobium sp.]